MSCRGRLIRSVKAFLDVAVLAGAFCLAFLARFEGVLPGPMALVLAISLPWVVLIKFIGLATLGVPRLTWRFISLSEARRITLALLAASVGLLVLRVSVEALRGLFDWASYFLVPIGVILIDLALSVLGSIGIRVAVRLWTEHTEHNARTARAGLQVPTLLVGVSRTGAQVAAELAARPDRGIRPLGFLDDDLARQGDTIHGIPVLGPITRLREILEESGAEEVLITTSELPGRQVREVLRLCESHGITTKIVPEANDAGGIVNLSRVRNVAIEDLLRREPVRLDNDGSDRVVRGRRLLITGAGGSIGSELCRQVCRMGPKLLLLVEKGENSLFSIHRELAEQFPEVDLVPCIADICDQPRMKQLFSHHRPEVVLHAAAHKHVPLMEENPGEAVKNNVLGTRGLADLADAFGVSEFMMISTDKAVNPSSVMGVSKRIAELYIQALAHKSPTRFLTVRFGNVLGSSGSVLPIFQEQIRRGGPVTVTHPEMQRYFMTIPEACQLVLETVALGHDGEVFILDMGEPVKIVELARDLIRLSGLRPDHDIEIRFTGIRPGEKLFEELSLDEEGVKRTRHPRIYIGRGVARPWEEINRQIDGLGGLADAADTLRIHAALKEIVPEYTCHCDPLLIQGGSVRADPPHEIPLPTGHLLEREPSVGSLAIEDGTVAS